MNNLENPLRKDKQPSKRLFGSQKAKDEILVGENENETEGLFEEFDGVKLTHESYAFMKKMVAIMEEVEKITNQPEDRKFTRSEIIFNLGNVLRQGLDGMPSVNDRHEIVTLNLNNLRLQSLPKLPESLENLVCSGNDLVSLPELPHNLKGLDCHRNILESMPKLPESLETLICISNHLPEDVKETIRKHKNSANFII